MTRCPACNAESDTSYRCSECGKDLVDESSANQGGAY